MGKAVREAKFLKRGHKQETVEELLVRRHGEKCKVPRGVDGEHRELRERVGSWGPVGEVCAL